MLNNCWANTQQVLRKCSAGAKWLPEVWRVISKRGDKNMLRESENKGNKSFFLTTRRAEEITAPQINTVSISRHFKHFIFLLRKCFCWGNFMLSKCQESLYELSCKIWSLRVKNCSYMSTLDLFLLFTLLVLLYFGRLGHTKFHAKSGVCSSKKWLSYEYFCTYVLFLYFLYFFCNLFG